MKPQNQLSKVTFKLKNEKHIYTFRIIQVLDLIEEMIVSYKDSYSFYYPKKPITRANRKSQVQGAFNDIQESFEKAHLDVSERDLMIITSYALTILWVLPPVQTKSMGNAAIHNVHAARIYKYFKPKSSLK